MAIKKVNVHGFTVEYEENLRAGIEYLKYDLDFNEAKIFFEAARRHGKADFEDDADRDWRLIYNRSKGIYTLVRR